jgi:hypothetical protein
MSGLKRSSLGLLMSVASSLSLGSWATDGRAQAESGVQACAKAYEDAQVQRNSGHLKSAQDQLRICVQDQCPDFVRSDCVNWLSEVNSALPTVTFAAVDSAGADLFDVKVSVDGVVVAESLDGRAIELDPGQHQLVFEYQGARVEQKLLVRQGEKNRVVRGQIQTDKDTDGDTVLDPLDKCPNQAGDKANGGCPAADDGGGDIVAPPGPAKSVWRSPLFLGGVVAGGVGVAGFVTSTIFWRLEKAEALEAHEECDAPRECTPARVDELTNRNQAKANVETVGLIVGGVGVVTSGVLFYLWYKDRNAAHTATESTARRLHVDVAGSDKGGFLQVSGAF